MHLCKDHETNQPFLPNTPNFYTCPTNCFPNYLTKAKILELDQKMNSKFYMMLILELNKIDYSFEEKRLYFNRLFTLTISIKIATFTFFFSIILKFLVLHIHFSSTFFTQKSLLVHLQFYLSITCVAWCFI